MHRLGLDEHVEFTGRVGPEQITRYLSAASAGLSPDPMSPLNDVSTMNKTMEYMAFAVPVVAYRLTETVVSAADCAVYVEPGDQDRFAAELLALLDDDERRADLGVRGRRRAVRELDWVPQARTYVAAFDDLTGFASAGPFPDRWPSVDRRGAGTRSTYPLDEHGNRLVDLRDETELRAFAAGRDAAVLDPAPAEGA